MPAPVFCRFHKGLIKNERTIPWTMSSMAFFSSQGQIIPKWLAWSCQNSNSSEILSLSWLPESLTKIWSIMNVLAWRYHFPMIVYDKFFQGSRARNTEVNDSIPQEFELIWDFTPVLDTCKFGEGPIKNDREKVKTPFSPLCRWEILVATTTRFLTQSAPKLNAAFCPLHWYYT